MRQFYVYIVTQRGRGVLYTGVTSDLVRRMYEHRHKLVPGFTSRYHLTRLVYFEVISEAPGAIAREKQIKGWLRQKKIDLIEAGNPEWVDLSERYLEVTPPA